MANNRNEKKANRVQYKKSDENKPVNKRSLKNNYRDEDSLDELRSWIKGEI